MVGARGGEGGEGYEARLNRPLADMLWYEIFFLCEVYFRQFVSDIEEIIAEKR